MQSIMVEGVEVVSGLGFRTLGFGFFCTLRS